MRGPEIEDGMGQLDSDSIEGYVSGKIHSPTADGVHHITGMVPVMEPVGLRNQRAFEDEKIKDPDIYVPGTDCRACHGQGHEDGRRVISLGHKFARKEDVLDGLGAADLVLNRDSISGSFVAGSQIGLTDTTALRQPLVHPLEPRGQPSEDRS